MVKWRRRAAKCKMDTYNLPKVRSQASRRHATESEIKQMIDAATNKRDKAIIALSAKS